MQISCVIVPMQISDMSTLCTPYATTQVVPRPLYLLRELRQELDLHYTLFLPFWA
jgi:hypothetical protein